MKLPGIGTYTLSELLRRLEKEEDKSAVLLIGFHCPHSYRGDHTDVAFEIRYNMTIQQIFYEVESAIGSTYTNIKGGNYTMHPYTGTWIVYEEDDASGEPLGILMMELLLSNRRVKQ